MDVMTLFSTAALTVLSPVQGTAPLAMVSVEAVQSVSAQEPDDAETESVEPEPVETEPEAVPFEADIETGVETLPDPVEVEAADSVSENEAETRQAGYIQTGGARAIDWLAATQTLEARFEQIGPDGTVTTGDLALERPGKIRFDYDDPSPILLVADGSTVAIADFDLETVDRAPISATPLRFLLGDLDTLQADGAIAEAGYSRDRLYVTLVDPEGEIDGRVTLVFEDPDQLAPAETMSFIGWYALDAMGGMTELRLSELNTEVRFDPRLFILDDEDVTGRDRRSRRRR